MTTYVVGLKLETGSRTLTIEAADALRAAIISKLENPDASVTYVRKSNRRGDLRHPHEELETESESCQRS